MNRDIVYELSKHTNVNNLLLSSKDMYQLKSEKTIENIKKHNSKDFVHIESVEALSHLIFLITDSNRLDLLRKFLRASPDSTLKSIVCASIIKIYRYSEELEDVIEGIVNMINSKELKLIHFLTKDIIDYRNLNEDLKVLFKACRSNVKGSAKQYINFYSDQNNISPIPDKLEFNRNFHELLDYQDYIEELLFNYTYQYEEKDEIFIRKMIDFIKEHDKSVEKDLLVRILKIETIDDIPELLLLEINMRYTYILEYKEKKLHRSLVSAIIRRMFKILSRKYNVAKEEVETQLIVEGYTPTYAAGFFEAVKYNNEKFLKFYLTNETTSKVVPLDNERQYYSDIDLKSKYIHYLKHGEIVYEKMKHYDKMVSYRTYLYYQDEIEKLIEQLIDLGVPKLKILSLCQNKFLFFLICNYLTLRDSNFCTTFNKAVIEDIGNIVRTTLQCDNEQFRNLCFATSNRRSQNFLKFLRKFHDRKINKEILYKYKGAKYASLISLFHGLMNFCVKNCKFRLIKILSRSINLEWILLDSDSLTQCKKNGGLDKLFKIVPKSEEDILEIIYKFNSNNKDNLFD